MFERFTERARRVIFCCGNTVWTSRCAARWWFARQRSVNAGFRAGAAIPRFIDRLNESFEPELDTPGPHAMQSQIDRLQQVQRAMRKNVQAYSRSYGEQQLKRRPWSRKEALGHLIDWGMAYQQWLVRALTQSNLVVDEYPQEEWISSQQYADFLWEDLIDLWLGTNRLLVHVLAQVPESKVGLHCTVGIQQPITLSELVERYVETCEDLVGQILAHL